MTGIETGENDPLCLLIDVGCMECLMGPEEAVVVVATCRASEAEEVAERYREQEGDTYLSSCSWKPFKDGWLRAGGQGGLYLLPIPAVGHAVDGGA